MVDDTVLGVDEAGRGSLVGPLVVGGFHLSAAQLPRLADIGVKDSKLLSPSRRTAIYEELLGIGGCVSVVLAPRTVDAWVNRGRLNDLEARAFSDLVRRTHPTEAFLDSCDVVPRRFAREVSRLSGTPTRVFARHHADRELVVVGAASIVAKVRRDRVIERLRGSLGEGIGSGYPSDARTIAFVRRWVAAPGPPPSWLRHSWSTTARLKAERLARTLDEFSP